MDGSSQRSPSLTGAGLLLPSWEGPGVGALSQIRLDPADDLIDLMLEWQDLYGPLAQESELGEAESDLERGQG